MDVILKDNEVLIQLFRNKEEVYVNSIVIPPNNKYRQYGKVIAVGKKVYDIEKNKFVVIPNFIDLRNEKKFMLNNEEYLLLDQHKVIAELCLVE